jgi:hypothetical protein
MANFDGERDVLVARDEHVKPAPFRSIEEASVLKLRPPHFPCRFDVMGTQMTSKRTRDIVIKKGFNGRAPL